VTYRLTRRAEGDVIDIYIHGARQLGPARADAYHGRLEEAFQLLAEYPRIGHERPEIDPPVRVHPCGRHIIVYVAEPDGNVLIVRVRHGREAWIEDPLGGGDAV
jgi:toxin ParE1/3/4